MDNPTPLFNMPANQGTRKRPNINLAYPISSIPHQQQLQQNVPSACPYPIYNTVADDIDSPYGHPSPYSISSLPDRSQVSESTTSIPSVIQNSNQMDKHKRYNQEYVQTISNDNDRNNSNNNQDEGLPSFYVPSLSINVATSQSPVLIPTPLTTPIIFPSSDKKKPRRKPPPIDFTSVVGSALYNEADHHSTVRPPVKPLSKASTSSSLNTSMSGSTGGLLDVSVLEHSLPNLSPILSPYCEIVRPVTTNESKSNMTSLPDSIEDHHSDATNTERRNSSNEGLLSRMEVFDTLTSDDWHYIANSNKIIELSKLGEGNGGSVSKCKLSQGSKIFALKLINPDPNPDTQKQITRELQYNQKFKSPYIVKYYGTFIIERQSMIGIAMEFMGGRSLDAIYKKIAEMDPNNRLNEKVLGKIAESILKGLQYLHQQKVIHRDIKPQNVLVSSDGCIKICDFGVSGEAVNSLATTFVGTQYYMAPERIEGKPYTLACDVWSLGLTLLEVASCKFPFGSSGSTNSSGSISHPLGPIELLSLILEAEPKLEDEPEKDIFWSEAFKNFILFCLKKLPSERPSPSQMLTHPWCVHQMSIKVKMKKFINRIWNDLDD